MPDVTVAQRHKLNRDPITDPHIILLEFQEDGQSAVNRAAVNTEDVVFEGNTFSRASIDIKLPNTGGDDVSAQLVASNIDRIFSRALNAATQRISVRLILIDTAIPDEPLIDTKNMLVIPSSSATAQEVTAQLGPRATLREPVPTKKTTKSEFPGVWSQ